MPSIRYENYTPSPISYSCLYDFYTLIKAPSHPSSINGYVCRTYENYTSEECESPRVYSDGICGYYPKTSDPCPKGGEHIETSAGPECLVTTWFCIEGTFDGIGCEVVVYGDVTEYRSRPIYSLGSTEIHWSRSDNDKTLLDQGYVLTGNKREVTAN